MADAWIGYWVIVTAAIVAILVTFCIIVLVLLRREREFFRGRVILACCRDLLEEMDSLHAPGNDDAAVASAKGCLRAVLDRITDISPPDVQLPAAELLAFLEDYSGREPVTGHERECVQHLMDAAGRYLDVEGRREILVLMEKAYLGSESWT